MYRRFGKRMLDLFFASLLFIILFVPCVIVIPAIIKLDSPGPVLFKQRRLGKDGKEFTIYKFRSMYENAEFGGVYCKKNDRRITRFGRFIRATSIDELPQLLNIIKGDMSFIGPRPPLTYHPWPFERYSTEQKTMFNVRPGITGWAQVNGRKEVEWNQRIEMSVYYARNISFKLDCKIILKTIAALLTNADNVNSTETAVAAPVPPNR